MPDHHTLVLGAVAYDPKVVTIWDGFKEYFEKRGLPFDYVLYSNYERQVAAQFAGSIQVAWNSPLAWIQSERRAAAAGRKAAAIAMRDSDCDLTSIILVAAESPIRSSISGPTWAGVQKWWASSWTKACTRKSPWRTPESSRRCTSPISEKRSGSSLWLWLRRR